MSVSGTTVDDMVAAGGAAPKDVEGEVKATGCGFEDRLGWDGPADGWQMWLWVGSWLLVPAFVRTFELPGTFVCLAFSFISSPSFMTFFFIFASASFAASSLLFLIMISCFEKYRCMTYCKSNIRDGWEKGY